MLFRSWTAGYALMLFSVWYGHFQTLLSQCHCCILWHKSQWRPRDITSMGGKRLMLGVQLPGGLWGWAWGLPMAYYLCHKCHLLVFLLSCCTIINKNPMYLFKGKYIIINSSLLWYKHSGQRSSPCRVSSSGSRDRCSAPRVSGCGCCRTRSN